MRFYLISILAVVCVNMNAQQELVGVPYHLKSNKHQLDEQFKSYNIYKAEISNASLNYKTQSDLVINFSFGKSLNAKVVLFKKNLLASNYNTITNGGKNLKIKTQHLAQNFEGYILDDPSSEVRLTISENYIYGYIRQGDILKYIEPARTFNKSLSKDTYILYNEGDVITTKESICAATQMHKEIKKIERNTKSGSGCAILDIAVAMDNSYVQAYGSNENAINQTTSILNMVEPNYNSAFTTNFQFSIVQHFIPTGSDPWTSSGNAVDLLDSFTAWGGSGFSVEHDIGQFWTDRDMYWVDPSSGQNNYSVAGLAWVGTVCGSARYHILENFTSSAWQLRVLTSHEMGHNFGAGHDTGSGNIMASSVNTNTNSWSTESIGAINASLSGFNCFSECYEGSCSEITAVATSNCSTGAPSTYTLTLVIVHGGGAAGSSGFDVNVDGGSYFESWQTSPQTVVIDGLTANGTIDHPVTISADNGSDSGCAGSVTYDEPSADCSLMVNVDFNDCKKPSTWTTTTSNNTIVNGGDPLVQYEWKFLGTSRTFGNYAAYSNGSTTKTIDGSCMAIMDDDIFNPTWYTGIVSMITEEHDVSNYLDLSLKFDYLFHKFEDGNKGANNSYFKVEVWNGTEYIEVLYDNTSTCPWHDVWPTSCMDHSEIDVIQYKNSNFKIRFTYSDGNDGAWAGMAALDNYSLSGTFGSSDCETMKTVSGSDVEGVYMAEEMVQTEGTTMISGVTIFSAGAIELKPGFEVGLAAEFTADNEGCSN